MKFLIMDLDSATQVAKFDIPRGRAFDFIAIINVNFLRDLTVKIAQTFNREDRSGFTPWVIIHGQIPYKFSNLLSP